MREAGIHKERENSRARHNAGAEKAHKNKGPFGETRTYKWVAEKVGVKGASRAVGNALNKNPFPIVVPCHRVVNSSGSPGEYAFGADLKKKLLELERTKNVA